MHGKLQMQTDELWEFSCYVYSLQGVASTCLILQDKYGLDVNLLLFSLFAGSRGYVLSTHDFLRIEAKVAPWRKNVVHELRAMRQFLKGRTLLFGTLRDDLYEDIFESELKAERHEQYLIVSSVTISESATGENTAGRNLMTYLHTSSVLLNYENVSMLARLLSIVMSRSTPSDKYKKERSVISDKQMDEWQSGGANKWKELVAFLDQAEELLN